MHDRILHACLALALSTSAATAQQTASPAEYLGHPLAADFILPDWKQVSGYFKQLDTQSPRVTTSVVGQTQEGREFLLSVISSEQNLAHLDELKRYAHRLADPRGASEAELAEAKAKGRVFVFVSCAMHATECAAPQFGMEFAWRLATSDEEPWKSARENCVVLLAPSLNPDGLDEVAHWYMKYVGTPYEGTELDKLYQLYAGHDNNRDWFALGLAETRLVSKLLYKEWFPQVYWDVHQQAAKAERMFVPPFRDPLGVNLDPNVIDGINLIGMRALFDMTREGKSGVSWGGTFDMWWNGGNRNVPVRHNMVGLLTEAASCKLASPIFLAKSELTAPDGLKEYAPSNRFPDPWPGGWWRLHDIVEYELAFGRSLIGNVSRERETWLANTLQASQRALHRAQDLGTRGWFVPADNDNRGGAERLCDVLLATGVELDACDGLSGSEGSVNEVSFSGNNMWIDGRESPGGGVWIDAAQPYAMHVKDLFDVQNYPGVEQPYDVAGWTLSQLFGVHVIEAVRDVKLDSNRHRIKDADDVHHVFGMNYDGAEMRTATDSQTWMRVFQGLAQGSQVLLYPHTYKGPLERDDYYRGRVRILRRDESADMLESQSLVVRKLPRIGLYSPWTGNADEGWMRWVFDRFGVKYVTVRNEELRAGKLAHFLDVLVLPGIGASELDKGRAEGSAPAELTGGLEAQGAVAVEEFVRGGGNLVAIGGSCKWAIDLLRLPLVDVTVGDAAKDFSCPGSVLRCVPSEAPLAAGVPESQAVFFSRSSAWREEKDKEKEKEKSEKNDKDKNDSAKADKLEVLLRYAPTRTLISGWIAKPEIIAGQAAWVRASVGSGHVHLFGFRPQYRGWSEAAFPLLFRALLFDTHDQENSR